MLSLPLDTLSWEEFEEFCEMLVEADLKCRVTHYGEPGEAQHGIDFYADLPGERIGFQARRVKKFTSAGLDRAVREGTFKADRYVLLVKTKVGVGVRDRLAAYPNWEVWDGRDIRRKLAVLPTDSARRILFLYFGPYAPRQYLGVGSALTFLPVEPSEEVTPVPSLVGRDQVQADIASGLERARVVFVTGWPGTGRTRVLKAIPRLVLDVPARQVAEGLPVTPAAADELPTGPLILLVDDAELRGDFSVLVGLLRQFPLVKLVAATTPRGAAELRRDCGDVTVLECGPLEQLTHEEAEMLAEQLLPGGSTPARRHVADLARQSPLVATEAARFYRDGETSFFSLANNDGFRSDVLRSLEREVAGEGDRKGRRYRRTRNGHRARQRA
jgi:hypothetical protein